MDNYDVQLAFNRRAREQAAERERARLRSDASAPRGARVAVIERALRLAFSEQPDLFPGVDPAQLAEAVVSLIEEQEGR
jgi:hypothetical protein